jgi:hypothetical protein
MASMFVMANFLFLKQKLWKFNNFFDFEFKFNQIILVELHQNFNTKKMKKTMEGFHLHQKILFQMNIYWFYFLIWSLWPFIKAFYILTWTHGSYNMSKYWQGNNLKSWNDRMYATTYFLSMCTRKITILMQMTKIREILIMFNEKPNIRQISKVIKTDMSH